MTDTVRVDLLRPTRSHE